VRHNVVLIVAAIFLFTECCDGIVGRHARSRMRSGQRRSRNTAHSHSSHKTSHRSGGRRANSYSSSHSEEETVYETATDPYYKANPKAFNYFRDAMRADISSRGYNNISVAYIHACLWKIMKRHLAAQRKHPEMHDPAKFWTTSTTWWTNLVNKENAKSNNHKYNDHFINDRVEVNYQKKGKYYGATIVGPYNDELTWIGVIYDEIPNRTLGAEPCQIRRPSTEWEPTLGSNVEAKSMGQWESGIITKIQGEKVHVRFTKSGKTFPRKRKAIRPQGE